MGAANNDAGTGDNGDGNFLPLEDNGMEMDVEEDVEVSREHVERNQVPHHITPRHKRWM